jgi:hypothetical protein
MSLLAHATFAAHGHDMKALRRSLDAQIQFEILEAKRIQREVGCTWAEALRLAARLPAPGGAQ